MISIVYPYLHELSQGMELRQSIRSLCKNLQFDFNVVIVGDKPAWYVGDHIPTTPVRGKVFARAFDIARKLEAIIESDLVTEDFIYCYDDQYAVSKVGWGYFGKLIATEPYTQQYIRNGSGKWNRLLDETMVQLGHPERKGLYNYETHLPRLLNKTKLAQLHSDYKLSTTPLLFSTIYYNEYEGTPDVVLVENNEIKALVAKKMTYDQIRATCAGKLWLNNTEAGWNSSLDRYLKTEFEKPCRYEDHKSL